MKVAFGSDHAGIELKLQLMEHLKDQGYECVDYGNFDPNDRGDDYPVPGRKVAEAIASGEAQKGVLVCGTGVGISLAANKVPGIRACCCSEPATAALSVRHNNCNIISMGARIIGREEAFMIADAFFSAKFEGGRHAKRVEMLSTIERDYGDRNC
jgi:ribose 5-phosphate isomerase B